MGMAGPASRAVQPRLAAGTSPARSSSGPLPGPILASRPRRTEAPSSATPAIGFRFSPDRSSVGRRSRVSRRTGLGLELAFRHGPPPGPVPLHPDQPDAAVLGPESVKFGRLGLPV